MFTQIIVIVLFIKYFTVFTIYTMYLLNHTLRHFIAIQYFGKYKKNN